MKALKKEGQDLECEKQEIQDIREAKVVSRIMVKIDSRVIAVHQDHRMDSWFSWEGFTWL